ncbi:MAG TPA: hypothetical protein VIZ68_06615 [Thermoplasmata archaeon]
MSARDDASLVQLMDQIETVLEEKPYRPWCIHRLYEELAPSREAKSREGLIQLMERAADEVTREGRAQHEPVSAIAIGVHCQDSLYWSAHSEKHRLEEFGPEYESPTILRRLASHFECRGL